ncbi:MAG: AI-2E family transporter [Deltaproteobacteria bacterium]|nr:AI-2E family transporter [Deltaproteobacteria bacterium]
MAEHKATIRSSPVARLLLVLAGLVFLVYLLYLVRGVAIPAMLGLTLAYLLHPAVDGLTRRKVPRWLAITLIFMAFLLALAIFLMILVPRIDQEFRDLAGRVPQYRERIEKSLMPTLQEWFKVDTAEDVKAIFDEYLDTLKASAPQAFSAAGKFLGTAFSGTMSFLFALFSLLLIPVFAIYFAYDYPRIIDRAKTLVPPAKQKNVFRIASRVDRAVASFVRGQVTVVFILAGMYSIGLSMIGLEMSVFIGVTAGLLNIVPYLGVSTGLLLGVLMSLLNFTSWWKVVGVVAVFAAGNTLDGLFITPKVVGDRVGLKPVVVIIALLAFGQLFGFLGVLIAVPATAAINVLLQEAADWWRASPAFTGQSGETQALETTESKAPDTDKS